MRTQLRLILLIVAGGTLWPAPAKSRYHPATCHNNDHCSPNYHSDRAGFTPNHHHHNRRRPSPYRVHTARHRWRFVFRSARSRSPEEDQLKTEDEFELEDDYGLLDFELLLLSGVAEALLKR